MKLTPKGQRSFYISLLILTISFIGILFLNKPLPNVLGLFSKRGTAYKAVGSFVAEPYIESARKALKENAFSSYSRVDTSSVKENKLTIWFGTDGVSGSGKLSPVAAKLLTTSSYGQGEFPVGILDKAFTFAIKKEDTKKGDLSGYVEITTEYGKYYGHMEGMPGTEIRSYKWSAKRNGNTIIGSIKDIVVDDLAFELEVVEEWDEITGGEEPSKADIVESRAKKKTKEDYKREGTWPRFDFENNEWMIDYSDEDVEEPGFREKWLVRRMKTQMKIAGILEKIKGTVFKEYKEAKDTQETPL